MTDTNVPPTEAGDEANEEIREERLDPDNRPDGAEVDNTDRTFDAEVGMFTDNPDYDGAEKQYDAIGEADEGTEDDDE